MKGAKDFSLLLLGFGQTTTQHATWRLTAGGGAHARSIALELVGGFRAVNDLLSWR